MLLVTWPPVRSRRWFIQHLTNFFLTDKMSSKKSVFSEKFLMEQSNKNINEILMLTNKLYFMIHLKYHPNKMKLLNSPSFFWKPFSLLWNLFIFKSFFFLEWELKFARDLIFIWKLRLSGGRIDLSLIYLGFIYLIMKKAKYCFLISWISHSNHNDINPFIAFERWEINKNSGRFLKPVVEDLLIHRRIYDDFKMCIK